MLPPLNDSVCSSLAGETGRAVCRSQLTRSSTAPACASPSGFIPPPSSLAFRRHPLLQHFKSGVHASSGASQRLANSFAQFYHPSSFVLQTCPLNESPWPAPPGAETRVRRFCDDVVARLQGEPAVNVEEEDEDEQEKAGTKDGVAGPRPAFHLCGVLIRQ